MKQITVAIAGLGSRGLDAYARYADEAPDEMKIVAVADILPDRVERAAKKYSVPADRCFASAEEMFEQEKLADAAFICTMDQDHYREAKAALLKGYDLLLEKPVSPSMDECRELAALAEKLGRKVIVGHVLRYTPFYRRLKAVLDEGTIGEVVSVQAIEKVCYWHQAHSFVRGNWRNSGTSSAMILQKCCHDMDILLWLTGKRCKTVSSFGSLTWFKPENAPEGATERCLDCPHKDDCLYSAPKFYLGRYDTGERDWPLSVLCQEPTREGLEEALRVGPYGRCVYHCDNNVVDHQVVNLLLEGGRDDLLYDVRIHGAGRSRDSPDGHEGRHLRRSCASNDRDPSLWRRGAEAGSAHAGGRVRSRRRRRGHCARSAFPASRRGGRFHPHDDTDPLHRESPCLRGR